MLIRASKRDTLARRGTGIVIDGYLRSGNTFSVAAFIVANGRAVHIGRHLHGAPHLLRANRLGLPAIALIRQPAGAVLSYLVRRPTLTPEDALVEYLDFYRTAWRARQGFVVGLFDHVVTDFGAIISEVNRKYGTSFIPYESSVENEAAAFAVVEEMNRLECRGEVVETHVGRPSAQRDDRKEQLRERMRGPKVLKLLGQADELYSQYASLVPSATATTPRDDDGIESAKT